MTPPHGSRALPSSTDAETYSIADPHAQRTLVASRTAAQWVGFFLPHLRRGMNVLDCGCGSGSITVDLAEVVAPGTVVGVDIDVHQLEAARTQAAQRGVTNVRFEVASIYALPFVEAAFDAALAHTLLIHLREPLQALKALRRVMKPGGVIAVADDDFSTRVMSPADPSADRLLDLWVRVLEYNGASPYYSRHLRHLLLEAGCSRTEGHAVAAEYYGTLEETRRFAEIFCGLLLQRATVDLVVEQGWASREEVARLSEWLRAWAERPDAFIGWMYCAALGCVPEEIR
jgi:ubiquinone/menaquinone biosynthesis C-methylase UbiE